MLRKNITLSASLFSLLSLGLPVEGMDAHFNRATPPSTVKIEAQKIKPSSQVAPLYQELAPTLAMMKIFLGKDFQEFSTDSQANEAALKHNVKLYFKENGLANYDYSMIMEQIIECDDELEDNLCKLIKREQEEYNNGNVVLYHGLGGDILFMYRYWGKLFSKLTEQSSKRTKPPFELLFRGNTLYSINPKTGIHFSDIKEVRDFLEVEKTLYDYAKEANISILHCNIGLFNGEKTSESTASSVYFWDQAYNASPVEIAEEIKNSLILLGVAPKKAHELSQEAQNLAIQYLTYEKAGQRKNNGGIIAISIPKDKIDTVAMQVKAHGLPYDPRFMNICARIDSINKVCYQQACGKSYSSFSQYLSELMAKSEGATANDIMDKIDYKIALYPKLTELLTTEQNSTLRQLVEEYLQAKSSSNTSYFSELNKKIDEVFQPYSIVHVDKHILHLSKYLSELILTSDTGATADDIMERISCTVLKSQELTGFLTPDQKNNLKQLIEEYLSVKSSPDTSLCTCTEKVMDACKSDKIPENSKQLTNATPEEAKYLTNEIALYLHPEIMKKASIYHMYRHPSLINEQMEKELDDMIESHILEIENSKIIPIPGAFFQAIPSPQKTNYNFQCIPYLIEHGYLFAAQQYSNADILIQLSQNDPQYCMRLLSSIADFYKKGFTDESGYLDSISSQLVKNLSLLEGVDFKNSIVLTLGSQRPLFYCLLNEVISRKNNTEETGKMSQSNLDMLLEHFVVKLSDFANPSEVRPLLAELFFRWNADENLVQSTLRRRNKVQLVGSVNALMKAKKEEMMLLIKTGKEEKKI